jgi:hypothetical protein
MMWPTQNTIETCAEWAALLLFLVLLFAFGCPAYAQSPIRVPIGGQLEVAADFPVDALAWRIQYGGAPETTFPVPPAGARTITFPLFTLTDLGPLSVRLTSCESEFVCGSTTLALMVVTPQTPTGRITRVLVEIVP